MSRKLAFLLAALLAAPLAAQYQMTLPLPGGGGAADPLTVLGPASACADNQLARWDGASNTALQCSDLSVLDVVPWDWSDGAGEVNTIDLRSIDYPFNISTLKTKIRLGATSSFFPIAPAMVYLGGDVVVEGDDITAPGALTISTAGSNGDITLDPNGTGSVIVPGYELVLGSEASGVGFCGGAGAIGCSDLNTLKLIQKNSGYLTSLTVGSAVRTVKYDGNTTNQVVLGGENATVTFGATRTVLASPAADVLEQRNSTNAQKFNLYGTYTNASNYERLSFSTQAGTSGTIAMETAGTGADNLDLILKPAGTGQFYIGAGGTTAAAPASVVVNATGGSGTDIAGASLTLAGGKGTGNAAGGSVVIQTSDPGSTGTTLQTLATRVTVGVARTNIANILSLTGIAAAPGSPAAGDIVYDSVNNLFCGYNGSAWVSFSGAGTCWAE